MYQGIQPPLGIHLGLAAQGEPVTAMIALVGEHRFDGRQASVIEALPHRAIDPGLHALDRAFGVALAEKDRDLADTDYLRVLETARPVGTGPADRLVPRKALGAVAPEIAPTLAVELVPGGAVTRVGLGVVGEVFRGVLAGASFKPLAFLAVALLVTCPSGKTRVAGAFVAVGNPGVDALCFQLFEGGLAVKAAVGGNGNLVQVGAP